MIIKKQSLGFTLIELLIVVAILGILSAVGIPMYQGYQKTAKYNATLANFNNASSFMAAELTKCGITDVMSLKQIADEGATDFTPCQTTADAVTNKFRDHFDNDGWKNPYTNENLFVGGRGTLSKGGLQLTHSDDSIMLTGIADNPSEVELENLKQTFAIEW